jgi:excisionase family DNA binding protein
MSEAPVDRLYSVREACEKLSIGKTLFWRLIREGEIVPTRFGTRIWIRESVLAKLLDDHTAPWARQSQATPPRGRGRPRTRAA